MCMWLKSLQIQLPSPERRIEFSSNFSFQVPVYSLVPMEIPCHQESDHRLLAAAARVNDLTLVTRNVKDVARTGVDLLDPFAPTAP